MTSDLIVGIDAGTSVIKAVAFDLSGRQVGVASVPNIYRTMHGGGVEQDMMRTWRDTAAVLRGLADKVQGLSDRVIGLGVTGQGDGTWLIDGQGAPVHDGWLWLDARAAGDAARIAGSDRIGAIYRATGTGVNTCQMRSHLPWMRRHAPDLLARAATAFHCKDWLYFQLTGQRATDPTEGVLAFGDFRTRAYSDEVIEALDLEDLRHLLPPIVDGATTTHALTAEAATATGLPAGLPVSLGYIDIACTALGAGLCDGAVDAGLTILGSTGAHMRYVSGPEGVRLNTECSGYTLALPGAGYVQLQTNMAATLNIDWVLGLARDILQNAGHTADTKAMLAGLDDSVLAARSGAAMFHPYISSAGERGPFTDPHARASLTGLDLSTGWADILRAVFDGLALAARDCYAAMGPMPQEVRLTGGAARSRALQHLLAGALGVPVRLVAQDEAGAAGAVMVAALALDVFPDAETATNVWVKPLLQDAHFPDPDLRSNFNVLFDGYRATREAMQPVWAAQSLMRGALS